MHQRQDDCKSARSEYAQALKAATGPLADPSPLVAAEEGIAQCDMDASNFQSAQLGFQRALARQVAATGENHPRVAEILNELGSLEYLRGDRAGATGYFRRTLNIDRVILGDRHPDVTVTTNNLARMLLEQRRFEEARALLQQSLNARAAEVSDTDGIMSFVFSNLALAEMGLRQYAAAQPHFDQALHVAILTKHRAHGPILTDLADLECRTGKFTDGLARLDEAQPIVAKRYPDDPWRLAHLDNVRAGCLTGLKRYADAAALISSSMPVLLPKWPPDTLYGYDALQRTMQLYSLSGDATRLAQYRKLAEKK